MPDTKRAQTGSGEDDYETARIQAVAAPRLAAGTRELAPLVAPSRLNLDDLADIVHDLKNPISTMMLETWLLEDRASSDLPVRDLKQALSRITHNLSYLDRMVQDLLDVCAADAGHLELRTHDTELHELVARVVARCVSARDQHRVTVDPGDPIVLRIDDLRIERVLANLLSNALKFSPIKTSVVVQIELLVQAVRVSVIDAGPGLDEIQISHVFARYGRAASARSVEGHGLGLDASRRIVEAHGGRLGVDSVPGVGSRFFFDLPVKRSR